MIACLVSRGKVLSGIARTCRASEAHLRLHAERGIYRRARLPLERGIYRRRFLGCLLENGTYGREREAYVVATERERGVSFRSR